MILVMTHHFGNQDALGHVMEKRAENAEIHGTDMPGHLNAAFEAGKETAVFLLLAWLFLTFLKIPFEKSAIVLTGMGLGWFIWKSGRNGWLGWVRLERLHRLIEQEKYEIEHHRPQEREELIALYRGKGFEGKLLEDVVDVLMADQDRLLKVMLEEEMGLTLQAYEHPLQQILGTALGCFCSFATIMILFLVFPTYGVLLSSFLVLAIGSALSAARERNRIIPAVIWNLSLATLAFGAAYFLFFILI